MTKDTYMTPKRVIVFVGLVLVFAGTLISRAKAQQISRPTSVVQLTGLAGVKENAKGTLSVEKGNLHFVQGKRSSDVSATSVEDVVTGSDSQKTVGKTVGMLSMAAPYGGGRFLSLFRTKIDTLTILYRDADGGLHGAVFTMPAGTADEIKKELLANGAHATAVEDSNPAASATSSPSSQKGPKQ
jgi:hypothetical protein